ncbi:hypothetical protein ABPG77_008001 [Micractinium sp. CCAP 211/92]
MLLVWTCADCHCDGRAARRCLKHRHPPWSRPLQDDDVLEMTLQKGATAYALIVVGWAPRAGVQRVGAHGLGMSAGHACLLGMPARAGASNLPGPPTLTCLACLNALQLEQKLKGRLMTHVTAAEFDTRFGQVMA